MQKVLGFGSGYVSDLLERYKTPASFRRAVETNDSYVARFAARAAKVSDAECLSILNDCNESGISIITYASKEFPNMLREIQNPPLLLFCKGDISFLNDIPCVAVIGPRKATPAGIKAAFVLCERLVLAGFGIISGGAKGIDAAAHVGAVSLCGKTAYILGCGHLTKYHPENDEMKDEILKNGGCILSEFPPNYPVRDYNFRPRNRIITGLSLGVIIPEAPEQSGALISASHAASQGRDVFVVPAKDIDDAHAGSQALINDGATPLISANQIIDEYTHRFGHKLNAKKAFNELADDLISKSWHYNSEALLKNKPKQNNNKTSRILELPSKPRVVEKKTKDLSGLSSNARALYSAIDKDLFSPDTIEISEELQGDAMFLALFELERAGLIESAPSGMYRRI